MAGLSGNQVVNLDSRIFKFCKKTQADAEGRFEIKGVPNGEYIVLSSVSWEFFNGHYMQRTGGDVAATVIVSKEDTYNVVVTR